MNTCEAVATGPASHRRFRHNAVPRLVAAASVMAAALGGCAAPLAPEQQPTDATAWAGASAVSAPSTAVASTPGTSGNRGATASAVPTIGTLTTRVPRVAPKRVLTRVLASPTNGDWTYSIADPTGTPSPGPLDITVAVRTGSPDAALKGLSAPAASGSLVCGQQGYQTVCLGGTPGGYVQASGAVDTSTLRSFLQGRAAAL